MYRSNIYPKMIFLVSFFVLGFSSVFAQTPSLELKLQLISADTWGVYVRPNGVSPSTTTVTGSAQVTVVMPLGFAWNTLTSVNGVWLNNAIAANPIENPGWTYYSFGWQSGDIPLAASTETLLFTFKRTDPCPDSLYLIDNDTDPFNVLPNSFNNNPGNEFSIIDFGVPGNPIYGYLGNYAPSAWSCHDCDGDGVLNAFEDSNGNGIFDVGVDSSAICDPCDPFHPISAALDFVGGAEVICAGDAGDTARMVVTIEGGWPPYEITYTDGTSNFIDTLYSGDTIKVVPTTSVTYDIVGIVDSFGCVLDTALTAGVVIEVHGPISVTDDPDNVTECFGNGTFFGIAAANAGDGTIQYKWQVNTGSGWANVQDGSVYDSTTTDTILIANVANKHGWQYRCKIFTSVCDTVYSAAATLSVEGPITVTAHPSDFTNCATEDATFTATANNAGAVGTMGYKWQYSSNGTNFYDIPNGAGGPGGATYANTTATTVNLTNIQIGMDGWYFRMKISTGQCDTIFTNAASLNIEGPITITADPADVSNCAGSEVFFIFSYSNPGDGNANYQWQRYDTGTSSWVNITNTGVYTGITGTSSGTSGTDTLTITNVVGLDGTQYRVCVTTPTCSVPVYSAAATLSVSGNVTFSNDPDDITVCSGGDTMFVANASIPQGTFTYGWQLSTDGGATWSAITLPSGVYSHSQTGAISSGTDTLFISNVAGLYNYRYRTVAFATDCDSVVSKEARLTVEGPLSILDQPDDVTECSGNAVQFCADIDNPGGASQLQYRWQLSTDGGSNWSSLVNNTIYGGTGTECLVISNVAGMHNYQVRLRVGTSTCNVIYTNTATITVEGPITVTSNPTNERLCSGNAITFTSTANVGTAGTLAYQWQVSSDNGVLWTNIGAGTDGGVYTNFNTTTLNISDVTGLYGRCYRLRFNTAECSNVFSTRACLTVEGPISITTDPVDITECSGDPVFFTVGTLNSSLDDPSGVLFKWQESVNGTTWTNIDDNITYGGTETDTLLITNILGKDNYKYRVQVWTSTCDTLISAEATLYVEGPLTVIDEPDNIAECSGSGVTFQATIANAGLGTILYQWERSCDLGVSWSDVAAGGANGYSGVTTTTLNISDIVGLDSCRFRLRYYTATCDPARTNYAVLQEEGPLSFTAQPVSDTICSGNPVCFNVETANATNTGLITYQWQIKPDGVSTWTNLLNNSTFSGVKTANMCIANVSGLDSASFRVLIQTAHCASVTSDSAVLRVEGPITFSTQPTDVTQCSAEGVTFAAVSNIQAGNIGTMTYQWQVSSDNINWNPVSNGGVNGYAGATTPTLTIGNVVGLNGRRYRLSVRTSECNPVYSNSALLTVEGPLSVVTNPFDITNCSDKEALLTADLLNPGQGAIQYQWQVSTDGGTTWQPQTAGTIGANTYGGTTSDTMLISPIVGLNGRMYRLQGWTGTCDTIATAAVTLNVEGPLNFTDHPDDVTLCSNGSTSFTVAVANTTGVGTIQYQWEVSANGVTWSNLTNTAPYSTVTTNTLNISNVTGLYNYKYRCKVKTANCEWSFSQLAQLFVEGPITIDDQPDDAIVCSNIGHIFVSEITNPGSGAMQFQWQVSSNSGSTWSNITANLATGGGGIYTGVKTTDLNVSLVNGLDGYMYRLLINTSTCYDTTDEVVLTVLDACTTGTCDFDLDGQINDIDADDDNDQLADVWEDYLTTNNVLDGWNYTDNTGGLLNYSNCNIDSDGDGILDGQEDPDGDNINNTEETDGDTIFDGDPLDPCDPILGPTCVGINLAIRVYLQGAKIGTTPSDTLMRDNLRSYGNPATRLIPATEPYSAMTSFEHVGDGGGEIVVDSTTVFAVTGPDAIVDWVFVELRSSTALDSVATTRAALLQRDGDVVDVDGVSQLWFPNANAGSFYLAVRHRNHLGVMTAEALALSPILTYVDFTDPTFLTTGNYAQIELSMVTPDTTDTDTRMFMWAGDLNSDGRTVYQGPGNDILKLFTTVIGDPGNTTFIANYISSGYKTADIDLSGRSIYQGPLNDRSMLLFNTILSHPANVNNNANYVILDALP